MKIDSLIDLYVFIYLFTNIVWLIHQLYYIKLKFVYMNNIYIKTSKSQLN